MLDDPAITILLHEYDSLRAEILSRYSAEFQVIGAGAAYFVGLVTVWLAGSRMPLAVYVILSAFAGLVIFALYAMADVDVTRASWRIQQIEQEVNSRAGHKLLVWETEWGMGGGVGRLLAQRPQKSATP